MYILVYTYAPFARTPLNINHEYNVPDNINPISNLSQVINRNSRSSQTEFITRKNHYKLSRGQFISRKIHREDIAVVFILRGAIIMNFTIAMNCDKLFRDESKNTYCNLSYLRIYVDYINVIIMHTNKWPAHAQTLFLCVEYAIYYFYMCGKII